MPRPTQPMPTMMFASPAPTVTSAAPQTSTAGSCPHMLTITVIDPTIIVDVAAMKSLRLVNGRGCQYDANASAVRARPPTMALASRVCRYT